MRVRCQHRGVRKNPSTHVPSHPGWPRSRLAGECKTVRGGMESPAPSCDNVSPPQPHEGPMNFHRLRIALIAGALALPAPSIPAAQRYPADHIKVYEPGTIAPDAYRVVKRLWTGTWRSAFALPSFPDVAAAIEAMKQEA